ncbi:hypothetical protein SAMN02910298_01318 [Pseudobutyrivibrio sp. YE44]|uniref:hypothetical protein n=1 Tax=Pseudobutyrivibrio sp. YE44 TaxID=1520802 RepID=UPI00088AB154|nr:hypothetical protein [Pseudobutyrivibrio sp. YE44]SDB25993.1 hypothetical protein SAMN02910298_01318 [Pseudobutyrivibrio sp. YE44]
MNVLEYSIKVGKEFRKTDEGRKLLDIVNHVEEKYRGDFQYGVYKQYVESKVNRFYFSSYRVIYQTLLNVLNEDDNPEKDFLVNIANMVREDDLFTELVNASDEVSRLFDIVAHGCLVGEDISDKIPKNWKFRITNSISNVKLAVDRTLMKKSFSLYNNTNRGFLYKEKAKEYFDFREKNRVLPFSKESIAIMNNFTELSDEEKMLYEKMFLVREAINQGIFFGFYGRIHEISEKDFLHEIALEKSQLKEIALVSSDIRTMGDEAWLYKVYCGDEHLYYMAHSKQLKGNSVDNKATILGIVYPKDDRRLFEDTIVS